MPTLASKRATDNQPSSVPSPARFQGSRVRFLPPDCWATHNTIDADCEDSPVKQPVVNHPSARSLVDEASMPRLGHKKSRLGCRQCKARHVKCDELKPCSNCARHGVPCSLVTWDPNVSQPPHGPSSSSSQSTAKRPAQASSESNKSGSTPSPSPSLHIDSILNPPQTSAEGRPAASVLSEESSPSSQSDKFPFLSKLVHQTDQNQSDIWLRDLELLHHWTIGVWSDLSNREDVREVLKVQLPIHAVTHVYMMHELLAYAAFHKAWELPDRRAEYYAIGIHHQDLSIRGIRERLYNVSPDEAAPIFITSVFLTMSVFASTSFEMESANTNSGQNAIDGILNIFHLLQGLGNVLALAQVHVLDSFLGPIFRDPEQVIPSQPMLHELEQQLPALQSSFEAIPDIPEPEKKVYLKAISFFYPALQMAMSPRATNKEMRFMFYWPITLEQDFFTYLHQRRSGALALIMYYSTILVAAESRHWFVHKWGDRLMRECYEQIDQRWHSIVAWPLRMTTYESTVSVINNVLMQAPGITSRGPASDNSVNPQPGYSDVPYRHTGASPSVRERQGYSSTPPYAQKTSTTTPPQDQKPTEGSMDRTGQFPTSRAD